MATQLRRMSPPVLGQHGDFPYLIGEQPYGSLWPVAVDVASRTMPFPDVATSSGNTHSFLQTVTPSVELHMQQGEVQESGVEEADEGRGFPFFYLKNFWSSLEQWSCYGVGVPIQLDSGEQVVQYYTPYLSGIQLFMRQEGDDACPGGDGRNDSDFSDGDFRDSSSDSSDTSERTQARFFECAAAVPPIFAKKDTNENSLSASSSEVDETSSPSAAGLAQTRDGSSCPELTWSTCVDCKGGDLCFQYFEKDRPHMRLPICDQVHELHRAHPSLFTLRSCDLHPSSWVSIAWYPLYMIPSTSSLKDVAASFLTFYGLSTERPPPNNSCSRCQEEFWAAPKMSDASAKSWDEQLPVSSQTLSMLPARALEPMTFGGCRRRVLLRPFGMCGYKVNRAMWSDLRHFESMRDAAESWVKQMGVNHPDHTFFSGQSFM